MKAKVGDWIRFIADGEVQIDIVQYIKRRHTVLAEFTDYYCIHTAVEEDQILEVRGTKMSAAVELGKRGGLKGGDARALSLSPEQRSEIAKIAANTRWSGDWQCPYCKGWFKHGYEHACAHKDTP